MNSKKAEEDRVVLAIPELNKFFMKQNITWVALLVMTMAVSCRSTKQINQVIAPKDSTLAADLSSDSTVLMKSVLDELNKNIIQYNTFSAKIKVDAEDNNVKQPDLTAVVRIIKDSAIWVSLSATFLNIEVYRVLITNDQVILMNKQEKEVQYRTLDYLQEVTNIPVDFKTLQDILIGNPVYYSNNPVAFRIKEDAYLISFAGKFFKHLLTISADRKLIQHSKLDDVELSRNRTASITYGEYENIEGRTFSTNRHISITEKKKLDVKLKYKQVEFNKELSVGLTVPKSYTRK